MKNIYFIEAKSPGAHIYSRTALPRLGTILLSTILKGKGYNAKTFIEDISEPDWKELEKADLIGISSITSTAPRAFKLASRFRFPLSWEACTQHSYQRKAWNMLIMS